MVTWNKELHSLSKDDVERISLEYLMGWQDLMANGHPFRVRGFNHMREKYGMEPLTKEMSFDYRLDYIRSHYTADEIQRIIFDFLRNNRVGDMRWTGIELFGCRFGREYARFFKALLGNKVYRFLSESTRKAKSIETQMDLYGGAGLAGAATKKKAAATNLIRYGGTNPMNNLSVREKLGRTNTVLYGGISPFSDSNVRNGGISPFSDSNVRNARVRKTRSNLAKLVSEYNSQHNGIHLVCESFGEFDAYCLLVDRFGAEDVYSQYGVHPYDARYPYNCDFYIKSLDLFIELNFYYVHGKHWFDPNSHDDILRLQHLCESDKVKNRKAAKVWADEDVKKRQKAKSSNLNYLVFWYKNNALHGLGEFNKWFFDYDCDFCSFIRDYPCNTY